MEKTVFPASFRLGYKELLLCCSAGFLFMSSLGCPEASQRHNIALLVFQAESTSARPIRHPFVSVCSSSLFSLFIMVLLPRAFMFSYNPPQPQLSSLFSTWIRLCGYPTRFSKPSKQLWLRRWPRVSVSLKQYVALWLGFSFQRCPMNALAVQSKFTLLKSACRLLQTLCGGHVGFDKMSRTMRPHQTTLDLYCPNRCLNSFQCESPEWWGFFYQGIADVSTYQRTFPFTVIILAKSAGQEAVATMWNGNVYIWSFFASINRVWGICWLGSLSPLRKVALINNCQETGL